MARALTPAELDARTAANWAQVHEDRDSANAFVARLLAERIDGLRLYEVDSQNVVVKDGKQLQLLHCASGGFAIGFDEACVLRNFRVERGEIPSDFGKTQWSYKRASQGRGVIAFWLSY